MVLESQKCGVKWKEYAEVKNLITQWYYIFSFLSLSPIVVIIKL